MEYSQDYTTGSIRDFEKCFSDFKEERTQPIKFLEVGCYEGRTSRWIIENLFSHEDDQLYCVDPWMNSVFGESMFALFNKNMESLEGRFKLIREKSEKALPTFQDNFFDGIYIDGSHEAMDVMGDAINALRIVKPNHIVLFDDYLWPNPRNGRFLPPKPALDYFLDLVGGWKADLFHKGYKLSIKKRG